MIKTVIPLLLWFILLGSSQAETYVYMEQDGTRWITDRVLDPSRFTFINKYGRPSAASSCKGMTETLLEQRANPLMPLVKRYAAESKLDPYLVKAVLRIESCFDIRAVSRAGAQGLMQLMPATAKSYKVDDPFDAKQNLRAGTQHLRDLLDKYRNNLTLALAAYNAGAHNVLKYNGVPPFRETQNYVKKVLHTFERYKSRTTQLGTN